MSWKRIFPFFFLGLWSCSAVEPQYAFKSEPIGSTNALPTGVPSIPDMEGIANRVADTACGGGNLKFDVMINPVDRHVDGKSIVFEIRVDNRDGIRHKPLSYLLADDSHLRCQAQALHELVVSMRNGGYKISEIHGFFAGHFSRADAVIRTNKKLKTWVPRYKGEFGAHLRIVNCTINGESGCPLISSNDPLLTTGIALLRAYGTAYALEKHIRNVSHRLSLSEKNYSATDAGDALSPYANSRLRVRVAH